MSTSITHLSITQWVVDKLAQKLPNCRVIFYPANGPSGLAEIASMSNSPVVAVTYNRSLHDLSESSNEFMVTSTFDVYACGKSLYDEYGGAISSLLALYPVVVDNLCWQPIGGNDSYLYPIEDTTLEYNDQFAVWVRVFRCGCRYPYTINPQRL